jgi:hypothetical protein
MRAQTKRSKEAHKKGVYELRKRPEVDGVCLRNALLGWSRKVDVRFVVLKLDVSSERGTNRLKVRAVGFFRFAWAKMLLLVASSNERERG